MTGSYRLGVVERSLAAGQLERVHGLLHVLDRNRHHIDTRLLTKVLGGAALELALKQFQDGKLLDELAANVLGLAAVGELGFRQGLGPREPL